MQVDQRITFIDGLRGIAILLVILFHAYARWTQHVPYGAAYAWATWYGHLGVQLFFLISGFVILMTLEKTPTFRQFILQRWMRLFPAMVVCSALIYLTAPFLNERPAGQPSPLDILPGILFIDPSALTRILGAPVASLDGAFWSIYVEVKFYILVGLAYYWRGRTFALMLLAAIYTVWLGLATSGSFPLAFKVLEWMGARHFPWFAAGALLFLHFRNGENRYAVLACVCVASALVRFEPATAIAATVISASFFLPVCTLWGRETLSSKPLQIIGAASYPLYLLHQNITIAVTTKVSNSAGWFPSAFVPVLVTIGLLVLAYWIALRVEPATRGIMSRALRRAASRPASTAANRQ